MNEIIKLIEEFHVKSKNTFYKKKLIQFIKMLLKNVNNEMIECSLKVDAFNEQNYRAISKFKLITSIIFTQRLKLTTLNVEIYKYDINVDVVTIEFASIQSQSLNWENFAIFTHENLNYFLIFKSILLFQVISRFVNLIAIFIKYCNHLYNLSKQQKYLNKVKILDFSIIVAKIKWKLTLKNQSQFELWI